MKAKESIYGLGLSTELFDSLTQSKGRQTGRHVFSSTHRFAGK